MILIFSTAEDISTFDVMQWLYYFGDYEVIRINATDEEKEIEIHDDEFSFQIGDRKIQLNEVKAVWYRKGRYWFCNKFKLIEVKGHPGFTKNLNRKIEIEGRKLSEYIHFIIEQTVPCLGSSFESAINKLNTLSIARSLGLLTPEFSVVNTGKAAREVFNQSDGLITKAISEGIFLFEKEEKKMGYFSYTEKVDEEMVNALPKQIPFAFLQKSIKKHFEIRTFYLDGSCYSMAIFSQNDEKTKIDFRKYNTDKPNRCVPYSLPKEIESKIIQLFKTLNLRTGSADLLLDLKGDFYFLEINPVGQFGMVSIPCNYYLEKKIAKTLIEDAKRAS